MGHYKNLALSVASAAEETLVWSTHELEGAGYTATHLNEALRDDLLEEVSEFLQLILDHGDKALSKRVLADPGQVGHDFILTRNHEGCGFWDGDWEPFGDLLTEYSQRFGEIHLYLGDDGWLYSIRG